MSIRALLSRKPQTVETIDLFETLKSAADKMREKTIASLVVVDRSGVCGILSERDLVHGMSVHGALIFSKRVADVMKKDVVAITVDESVKQAMRLMTRYKTRHLLVLDAGVLVGILSLGDVVKDRLDYLELETNVLRDAYIAAH